MRKGIMVAMLVMMGVSVFGVSGCSLILGKEDPNLSRFEDKVVTPLATKALTDTTVDTWQMIGGGQAIEPAVEVEIEGGMYNGFKGKATIRLKGIAVQAQAATQAAKKEPITEVQSP